MNNADQTALFHSPLIDTQINGPLLDSYCIEMKMFNAITQSVNTSRAAMVRHFLSMGVAENMENNMDMFKRIASDVDLIELLTKSHKMNKEFKTFFQGQNSLTLSQAAATSQVIVENCIKLQTVRIHAIHTIRYYIPALIALD